MSRTPAQKAQHATEMAAATHKIATADVAVDTVNPGPAEGGAEHTESISAEGGVEDTGQVQYTLDPQMVQQAMQNRNARLIAMMVNENAMMEVALEQERTANGELRAKMRAMQDAFGVETGTGNA